MQFPNVVSVQGGDRYARVGSDVVVSAASGPIFLAVDRVTGRSVACGQRVLFAEASVRELACLNFLRSIPHPGISTLLDQFVSKDWAPALEGGSRSANSPSDVATTPRQAVQGADHLYLVFPAYPCSLWSKHFRCEEQRGALPDEVMRNYLTGITEAVAHLHSLDVVHGCLSLENVLLDERDNPIIGDFGTMVTADSFMRGRRLQSAMLCTQAPEVLLGDGAVRPAGDVWAVGLIALAVCTGHVPIHSETVAVAHAVLARRGDEERVFWAQVRLLGPVPPTYSIGGQPLGEAHKGIMHAALTLLPLLGGSWGETLRVRAARLLPVRISGIALAGLQIAVSALRWLPQHRMTASALRECIVDPTESSASAVSTARASAMDADGPPLPALPKEDSVGDASAKSEAGDGVGSDAKRVRVGGADSAACQCSGNCGRASCKSNSAKKKVVKCNMQPIPGHKFCARCKCSCTSCPFANRKGFWCGKHTPKEQTLPRGTWLGADGTQHTLGRGWTPTLKAVALASIFLPRLQLPAAMSFAGFFGVFAPVRPGAPIPTWVMMVAFVAHTLANSLLSAQFFSDVSAAAVDKPITPSIVAQCYVNALLFAEGKPWPHAWGRMIFGKSRFMSGAISIAKWLGILHESRVDNSRAIKLGAAQNIYWIHSGERLPQLTVEAVDSVLRAASSRDWQWPVDKGSFNTFGNSVLEFARECRWAKGADVGFPGGGGVYHVKSFAASCLAVADSQDDIRVVVDTFHMRELAAWIPDLNSYSKPLDNLQCQKVRQMFNTSPFSLAAICCDSSGVPTMPTSNFTMAHYNALHAEVLEYESLRDEGSHDDSVEPPSCKDLIAAAFAKMNAA